MTDDMNDFNVFDPVDAAMQLSHLMDLIPLDARVVDLGAGTGRLSRPLQESGCSVLAVDRDADVFAEEEWSEGPAVERLTEDFLSQGARWPDHGPFDVALCLGNTMALILDHEEMVDFFCRVGDALRGGGVFLMDDFPVWGWNAVQAGDWSAGISADGTEQLVWLPGEPIFAYRRGQAVDPEAPEVLETDRLLRLWSVSELRFLAERAGFLPPRHDPGGLMLIFEQAPESNGTSGGFEM